MPRSRSNTPAAIGDTSTDEAAAAATSSDSPPLSSGQSNQGEEAESPERNEVDGETKAEGDEQEEDPAHKDFKLYKSPRLKGYLMMLLSSIINYHSITVSQDANNISAVVPSSGQIAYGRTVAVISMVITGVAVFFHFMSWFTYKCDVVVNDWAMALFAPKAKIELFMAVFLLIWWFIATCTQTTVRGIAGDGKGQYNIFYSTWFCNVAAMIIVESKVTEFGFPNIKEFVQGWPNRAPGWIAMLVSNFFTVFWYVDLYISTSKYPDRVADILKPYWGDIPSSQYELLIFVSCMTLVPTFVFVSAEIFRNSSTKSNVKSSFETYAEGISLLLLTIGWVPSVIVATTPGGFAAYIGNAYFFTWATTVLVLETTMWFVHDSRGGVHATILQKEEEYRQHQQDVLEATRKLQMGAMQQREEEGQRDRKDNDWLKRVGSKERGEMEDAPIFAENAEVSDEAPVSFAGIKEAIIPPREARENEENTTGYEMRNSLNDDDALDDTIRQERRMREANMRAYFDTLDDILE